MLRHGGGSKEFFILVTTDILDHDAQVGGMMVSAVLSHLCPRADVDWGSVNHLLIVADCGPHFRSEENVAHFCVALPMTLRMFVEVCWLVEQHGNPGLTVVLAGAIHGSRATSTVPLSTAWMISSSASQKDLDA